MRNKKNWDYIACETALELLLIFASLMIFFKFDVLHLSYTILGVALIVIVVMARMGLEHYYK